MSFGEQRYPAREAKPVVSTASNFIYAGFWRRLLAYLIDCALISVGAYVLAYLLGLMLGRAGVRADFNSINASIALAALAGQWLYFALLESGPRQASIGKRAVGIRVTNLAGLRPTFWRATARHFGKLASSAVIWVGFLMIGWTKRKQGLHDFLAGTLVLVGPATIPVQDEPLRPADSMGLGQATLVVVLSVAALIVVGGIAVLIPQFAGNDSSERSRAASAPQPSIRLNDTAAGSGSTQETAKSAIKNALAAQLFDSRPPIRSFESEEERVRFVSWLGEMSTRLSAQIPDYQTRIEFLRTLDYEAARAGLDRQMLLAVIDHASGFRTHAMSAEGARGYMQVLPRWTNTIGDGDGEKLLDMRHNLRYGATLLRAMLDKNNGDLYLSLSAYSREVMGVPAAEQKVFPNNVHRAWKSTWSYISEPASNSKEPKGKS